MENQSAHQLFEAYRRRFPLYRGPHRLKRFIGWLDEGDLRIGVAALLLGLVVVGVLDWMVGVAGRDVLVEAHGLVMDLLVFGCLLVWFNTRRERRQTVRRYRETLEDLAQWSEPEGVLRKVGVIRRLNDLGAPLPPLDHSQLPKANFQGAPLSEVTLNFANLREAFLNGTDFRGANLAGADLRGSCLAWARLDDADLRGADLRDVDLEGARLDGARLGVYTVGQARSEGPTSYRTDLRGAEGLDREQLLSTKGWEDARRSEELSLGSPIP